MTHRRIIIGKYDCTMYILQAYGRMIAREYGLRMQNSGGVDV